MKNLFQSGKLLLLDMASTCMFLLVLLVTGNIPLSVASGVAMGIAQLGIQLARRRPIGRMEGMSLFLVVGSGAAALLTNDARFVMLKPSLIYAIIGVVMLTPGWMNRYLPPKAIALVPDIARLFGFAWALLMFASAVLNVIVALNCNPGAWSVIMTVYGILSKAALFLAGYGTMRFIGARRFRAMATIDRNRLQSEMGR